MNLPDCPKCAEKRKEDIIAGRGPSYREIGKLVPVSSGQAVFYIWKCTSHSCGYTVQ